MRTMTQAVLVFSWLAVSGCKAEMSIEAAEPGSADAAAKAEVPADAARGDVLIRDAAADPGRKPDGKLERQPPPDAFFGDSRCPDGVLFCEDFEGNALDPAKWTIQRFGSSIEMLFS